MKKNQNMDGKIAIEGIEGHFSMILSQNWTLQRYSFSDVQTNYI